MARYKVRVWISDIDIEADTAEQATDKAAEMVDDELRCAHVEYVETLKEFINGRWKNI